MVENDVGDISKYKIKEINDRDLNVIVELLFSHVNRPIQELLKSKKVAFTGTSDKLKKRLIRAIEDGFISTFELSSLLDQLEDYGNQHIFLFIIPEDELPKLNENEMVHSNIRKGLR